MLFKKIKTKPWYSYTVAICAGVLLFVILTHLSSILSAIGTFIGYFMPVILGCVIAYLINPLANFYNEKVFSRITMSRVRTVTSNSLAFITILLFLVFVMVMLIPQMVSSVSMFVGNIDAYVNSLDHLLGQMGLSSSELGLEKWLGSSGKFLHSVSWYLSSNMDKILATSANAGLKAIQWLIAFLLSVYLLANKEMLKTGLKRFLKALMEEKKYENTKVFLLRCNKILNRYIVFNILDALLVGIVNMIFMLVMGLPYAGLVSVVVGLTNLVPTFGPFVGGAIGAFILLLVKPWYAIIFMIFTLVLQLIDGYVIKPKLFGGSLGVPALWILIAIVAGGKMFGVIGILLSIPLIAILHFSYKDYFLPWLEGRRKKSDKAKV